MVPDILGAAVGDVQPAMNAIASLAAAELHPGGKDGEVTCYYKTVRKAAVAAKIPVIENIDIKRISVIIIVTHCIPTAYLKIEFKTQCYCNSGLQ